MNFSLEQVAQKVKEGGVHPKVRAWALEQLERGRRELGLRVDNDRERATVLLRAVAKKLWVPDPVGSEFIAGAHLMACDRSTPTELCFLSGDCDDKVVLLSSCFLSVGLQTAIAGHAYDGGKNISHVLSVVRVDGKWQYADPTPTDFKLGECVDFTRERILSVPNVKVICDAEVCFRDGGEFHPHEHDFVTEGRFIGVDGQPKFAWLKPTSALGQSDPSAKVTVKAVVERCTAGRGTTKEDLKGAAGCAADVFCATYGVPPGACGAVAEFVLDVIDEVFSAVPGMGFEGYVNRSMYMHNRLFPREPKWQWDKVAPLQGIHLTFGPQGDGFYVPNSPTRQAYAAVKPPYSFPISIQDLGQIAAANYQVEATLAARAAEERARGTKRLTVVPVLAAGAAGAAVWYFWSDLVRLFR